MDGVDVVSGGGGFVGVEVTLLSNFHVYTSPTVILYQLLVRSTTTTRYTIYQLLVRSTTTTRYTIYLLLVLSRSYVRSTLLLATASYC